MKIKNLLIILSFFFLVGCEREITRNAGLDGMVFKDNNGKFWQLRHNIANTYFILPVDTNKFSILIK